MPDDSSDGLADSPKDTVTGTVKKPPDSQESATARSPPKPAEGAVPAGQRNSAYDADKGEGADHDTEEAAAYRENDA